MAATITVEHKDEVKRQDTFRVNPNDVKLGVNARNPDGKSQSPDYPQQVLERAVSIAIHGQLQPVGVRRNENKELVLTFGFTRRDAILLLREGFTAIDPRDGETHTFHDPDATLWVKVEDCDDREAFLRSVKENKERNDVTDYQEAKQHAYLRSEFGWKDADIARFYGYTNQNRVAALARLLTLPEKRQQQVHEGKLALYTAFEASKIKDEAEREKILDGALVGDKIDGSLVKKLIRDAVAKASEAGGETTLDEAAAGGSKPKSKKGKKGEAEPNLRRGVTDLKKFCDEVCDETTVAKPKVKELFAALKDWIGGSVQDKTLWNRINAI